MSSSSQTKGSKYRNEDDRGILRKMITTLKWTSTPSRVLPHGAAGLVLVMIGLYLIKCCVLGDLGPFGLGPTKHRYEILGGIKYLHILLYTAAAMNAIGGYMLSSRAPKYAIPIFRNGAIAVVCLIYYAIRFSPDFSTILANYDNITALHRIIHYFDVLFAIAICWATFSFYLVAYNSDKVKDITPSVSIAMLVGSIGMTSFTGYPIQLAYDYNWWDCVVSNYPLQGIGMTAYVYLPIITIFSICAFLPTLYLRKIINDIQLSVCISIMVFGILFSMIMAMEWYLPFVSTQRLYIPCTGSGNDAAMLFGPSDGSWNYFVMNSLDVSKATQYLIVAITGKEMPQPIHTEL